MAGPNVIRYIKYRGADKSLARPRRKQTNVSVRIGVNFIRGLAEQGGGGGGT